MDVDWVQGDALELPFSDDSFDAATIGYGLRCIELQPPRQTGRAAVTEAN